MRSHVLQLTALIALISLNCVCLCGQNTETTPDLKTSANGAQYYLSLPKDWSPNTTWPIVVTIDGSGHNFPVNAANFAKARGTRPFILVTPCVSSNGNDPADLKAVLAIVEEVQKSAKGQPKFFITGFSAGGHVMWQCVFTHPELLAGAASAAGNFRFRGVETISKDPARVKLPIHEFLGDKDQYHDPLAKQWDDALKLAHENGYENLTKTDVPNAGHQAFASQVLAYFETLPNGKNR